VGAWQAPPTLADRAWIVESLDPAMISDARPAWSALRAEGRAVAARGGGLAGGRPAVVQIWGPPGWRGTARTHPEVRSGP
jgi:hypothetical protein